MVKVAFSAIFVGFGATEKVTEPVPVPELPETTVTHDGCPDTVH